MARWRSALNEPKATKRRQAEEGLEGVTDPRAVPAIWQTFAQGSEADQRQALALLGRIESGSSSRALAAVSVFSASPEIRRQATEVL